MRLRTLVAGVGVAVLGVVGGGGLLAIGATPAGANQPVLGEFLVMPGMTLKISNAYFDACDSLTWGYQLGPTGAPVELGSHSGCTSDTTTFDGTIGPFPAGQPVIFYLQDTTGGDYYFLSTGNHAATAGLTPRMVAITDSASGNYTPANPRPPTNGVGNLNFTVQACFGTSCNWITI